MKILLLGANGQVGHELRRALLPLGELTCTTRSGMLEQGVACEVADFDKPEALSELVQRIAPDIVVNAAAYTAVDRAEDDADAAFRVNAEAPKRLAEACAERGARLVHYSTDYVFDGQATRPYREDDATAPLGVYGASKLAGEEAIQSAGCQYMILRTAWVYGNYGSNFMRTMLRLGAERDRLSVVADQYGTPTRAALIADVTGRILQVGTENSGVWHLTSKGMTSWYGFARAILEHAAGLRLIDTLPQVAPISTADYPTRARRPGFSCLATDKVESEFNLMLPDWEQDLEQLLKCMSFDCS